MVRHGAPLATDSAMATPISTKTLATLGKDQADDRQLSLDGLHAKWRVVAPSDDGLPMDDDARLALIQREFAAQN